MPDFRRYPPPSWRSRVAIGVLVGVALFGLWLGTPATHVLGRADAVDGDTLRLNGQRVRLEGIDAPELRQDCKRASGATWACGAVAADTMRRLLAKGPVDCEFRHRDIYGRPLARCRQGATDIAAAMASAGLAVADGGYFDEVAQARAAGHGIWSGTFQPPAEWRHAHGEGAPRQPLPHFLHWFR